MSHKTLEIPHKNFTMLSVENRIKIVNVLRIPNLERIFYDIIPEYKSYFGVIVFVDMKKNKLSVILNHNIPYASRACLRLFLANLLTEIEVQGINAYL